MINELIYLAAWCENYKEKTSIKLHPNNVPVHVLLDELIGELSATRIFCNNLYKMYEDTNNRLIEIQGKLQELAHAPVIAPQETIKTTKKNSKLKIDKKEVKK